MLDIIKFLLPIITALVMIAFDWGILYQKIKSFITKEQVKDMINEKLMNHCPNTEPIKNLEQEINIMQEWKQELIHSYDTDLRKNQLQLQEIRINLKGICEKLGVEYHNGNK